MATLIGQTKSPFKTAAYQYIRSTDNLPKPEDVGDDPIALVKIFDPGGSWTWYVAAYDPETHEAYGLVDGFEAEVGYFSFDELVEVRSRFRLPLERDLYWTPKKLSECMK